MVTNPPNKIAGAEMNVPPIDESQRKAARIAGICSLFAMIIVVCANYWLLNPLMVAGNAGQTARNIAAHELQFRIALTGFLTYSVTTVVLVAALYVIFRPVSLGLALVAALFRLVFALLWLLSTLNLLGALRLASSTRYLQVFEPDRLQALARFHIATTFDDYYVGLPFFALALTVCSYLWLKSSYVPRWLSIFGLISSGWCVVCAFAYLIVPNFGKVVNPYWFDTAMALFELVLGVWLLVKGLQSGNAGTKTNK
jgi:Domain of unknown function (DUF4386)